jgi:hypothetical protein
VAATGARFDRSEVVNGMSRLKTALPRHATANPSVSSRRSRHRAADTGSSAMRLDRYQTDGLDTTGRDSAQCGGHGTLGITGCGTPLRSGCGGGFLRFPALITVRDLIRSRD